MNYQKMFERNLGILTGKEQQKLKNARLLIIGCGGIGGTVAIILARSGIEKFTLVEFDDYDYSNINRQIGSFQSTIGKNKAKVIAKQIKDINPDAKVKVYPRLLTHDEIKPLINEADVVFPAADDLAFSIFVFKDCQELRKPALLVIPAGTWANVSVILPDRPSVETLFGAPSVSSYPEMLKVISDQRFRLWTRFFVTKGHWLIDHYEGYIKEQKPLAQLCSSVWLCSSLGAQEIIKVITEKWEPVAIPEYWSVSLDGIKKQRLKNLSKQSFHSLQNRIIWKIHHTFLADTLHRIIDKYWHIFYNKNKKKERDIS